MSDVKMTLDDILDLIDPLDSVIICHGDLNLQGTVETIDAMLSAETLTKTASGIEDENGTIKIWVN